MPIDISEDHSFLIEVLTLLKVCHTAGIYDTMTEYISMVDGEDFYELQLLGLECVAPICRRLTPREFFLEYRNEQLDDDFYENNEIWLFGSPEMLEYYRLCRLYEYREGVESEVNPYVIKADKYYDDVLIGVSSNFGVGFDDYHYTRMLLVETCYEWNFSTMEVIGIVRDMLEFYRQNLPKLDADLKLGRITFLPELPAYKGGNSE